MPLCIIVAVDENNLIGNDNKLPWKNKEDMKYFKDTTIGSTVIMGRKTYDSLKKALPERLNIVLTRDLSYVSKDPDIHIKTTIDDCFYCADEFNCGMDIFVIGGKEIYELFLPIADLLYVTRIKGTYEGDVYFPNIDENEWNIFSSVEGETCTFEMYSKN